MKKDGGFKIKLIFLLCGILFLLGLFLIAFQDEINSVVKSYLKDKPSHVCESREML